jgi:flagellar biosynthesis/type III secretory pathway chaperone
MDIENTASQALISELDELASEFTNILSTETRVMETRSSDALAGLMERKNELIARLQQQESMLVTLFTEYPDHASVKELKLQFERCQELNRRNQSIALLELKHTQNSLELLRSLLNLDDLPLYSPVGQIRIKREKRNLGSA